MGGKTTNEDRWLEIEYTATSFYYCLLASSQTLPILHWNSLSDCLSFHLQVEDLADDLDGRSLAFLQAGFTYLVVTSKLAGKGKAVQLRAKITKVGATLNI